MAAAESSPVSFSPNDIVNNWKVVEKIGEGACGAVFKVEKNGQMYAMKTENVTSAVRLLKMEVIVLRALKSGKTTHFCEILDSGRAKGNLFMVMTLIGKTLHDLRKTNDRIKMTLACSLSVGLQCLEGLQELHNAGYLHRDVKPGNFAVALDNPRRVILFDFGMSRKYLDKDNTLRKPRWIAGFRGTVRYAPLASHHSREMSRKDDLESWMYQQIELTSGQLPWKNIDDPGKVSQAKEQGRTLDRGELFGGCPKEYLLIMYYIDDLKFYDTPKYSYIRGLLREAMDQNNLLEWYDWDATQTNTKPDALPVIKQAPPPKNKNPCNPCKQSQGASD